MIRFLLLFFCFWTHFTLSEEAAPPTEIESEDASLFSLVDSINSPVPHVHGTVSLLSGAWLECSTPMSDGNTVDPYHVGYRYASSSLDGGTLGSGWEFFHPSEVEIFEPRTLSNDPEISKTRLTSREAGGATFL